MQRLRVSRLRGGPAATILIALTPCIFGCDPIVGPDLGADLPATADLYHVDLTARPLEMALPDMVGPECETPFNCPEGACVLGKCSSIPFSVAAPIATGKVPVGVAIADFDRDGRTDIVVSSAEDPKATLLLLLGQGGGAWKQIRYSGDDFAYGIVAAGDFNSDKQPDIALGVYFSGQVAVYLNRGGLLDLPALYPAGAGPFSVAAGDLDGDGRVDIAVGDTGEPDSTFLVNTGKGFEGSLCTAGIFTQAMALGDINEDGCDDVVKLGAKEVAICWGSRVALGGWRRLPPFGEDQGVYGIAVADFNGDKHQDVAAVTISVQQKMNLLRLYWGDGKYTFLPQPALPVGWVGAGTLIATDLNGDRRPDVVVSTFLGEAAPPGTDSTLTVFLNQGGGKFLRKGLYRAAGRASNLAAGDFNGDGKPDLAVLNQRDNQLNIWLNKGVW